MSEKNLTNQKPNRPRRAMMVPSENDTRLPRQFLETLMQGWVRDAFLLENGTGAGKLRAMAGEAAEFGIEDHGRAFVFYEQSAKHKDADPRAFAGLRRAARHNNDLPALFDAYVKEHTVGITPSQRALAGVGAAQLLVREGIHLEQALDILDAIEAELSELPNELIPIVYAAREDVLTFLGEKSQAISTRIRRWGELERLTDEASEALAADGAIGVAIACEILGGSPKKILTWYNVAFEAKQAVVSARTLLRTHFACQNWSAAEPIIAEVTSKANDLATRKRYQFELGMIRAYRLDDHSGGLQTLNEASKEGPTSPIAASAFLSLARSAQGSVMTEELLETLATRLDFCASNIEKADLMTQMALRVDQELKVTPQAMTLLEKALEIAPGFAPALRGLGHIYRREGEWQKLAKLGEQELKNKENTQEIVRAHERLAELYENKLKKLDKTEFHFREALKLKNHLPIVRKLSRLLSSQMRWQELFEHIHSSAKNVQVIREKVYLLEQAAKVAEQHLQDGILAIKVYNELLQLQPEHPSAVASSGRLLTKLERWAELLELNEFELSVTNESVDARVAILARSAEICERHLGDIKNAEKYYQRALEEDRACDQALRGLGKILKTQLRWGELIEMTEQEMAAAQSAQHRFRTLRQLGELYAIHSKNHERAINCFEELAENADFAHEEALVWLERLYEATNEKEQRLATLARRLEKADNPKSRARLAYRTAELLEWGMNRGRDAFEYYIESLADLVAAPTALEGLDRLWELEEIDEEIQRAALSYVLELANVAKDSLKCQALIFVAERSNLLWTIEERVKIWAIIAAQCPSEPKAAEFCALFALEQQNGKIAEQFRALRQVGPVRIARSHWIALDSASPRDKFPSLKNIEGIIPKMIARENGDLIAFSPELEDRNTFYELGHGILTLNDLKEGGPGETATRLAVFANQAVKNEKELTKQTLLLAETLNAPLRSMRVYLDFAALDFIPINLRKETLKKAAMIDSFHSSIRDELYDAMQRLEDWDSLEQAIQIHLTNTQIKPEKTAQLARRRAMALEVLGRFSEAITTLQFGTNQQPQDALLAIEKSRIETQLDKLDAARDTLEKCLKAGIEGENRIEILGRVAELHQMKGGNQRRTLEALEDAYQLAKHEKKWAMRLANAHAQFGTPGRAAELLESALSVPLEEKEVRYWLILARIYTSQDAPAQAEEILWSVFATFPEKEVNLKALETFYRKVGGAEAFTERLATLLTEERLKLSKEGAGKLWLYIGELYYSVLEAYHLAQNAYRKARKILGSNAENLLREAKATSKLSGKARQASNLLIEALTLAEKNITMWENASGQLEIICAEIPDPERLRIVTQVRRAIGMNVSAPNNRVKRDPTRELEANMAWHLLGSDLLKDDELDVLQGMAALAERVFAKDAPNRREYSGNKLRSDRYNAFSTFLDLACRWLGVERPKVFVGEQQGGAILLNSGQVWVSGSVIRDEDPIRARFWAGYVAGLIFTGLMPYAWSGDELTRELMRAVAIRGLHLHVPEGSALEDDVSGLLNHLQRKQAASALKNNLHIIDQYNVAWSTAALTFADRAGMLTSGDISIAMEEILTLTGWQGALNNERTREQVISTPRTRSLLLYALSDKYLNARFESGLSPKPLLIEPTSITSRRH